MPLDLQQWRETYFQEAAEHLSRMEGALLRLESNANDGDAIQDVFRSAHSLKGDSASLGFDHVERLAHSLESVLAPMRDGSTTVSSNAVDILLRATDAIATLLQAAQDDAPVDGGYEAIVLELENFARGGVAAAASLSAEPSLERDGFELFDAPVPTNEEVAPQSPPVVPDQTALHPPRFFGEFLLQRNRVTHEQLVAALDHQHATQPLLGRVAIRQGKLTVGQVFETLNYMSQTETRFGETAVILGYLTDHTLDELLDCQRRSRRFLGDILTDMGFLSSQALAEELEAFLSRHAENEEALADVANAVPPTTADGTPAAPDANHTVALDVDLLSEFVNETREHLDAAERHLLVIDENPTNEESLNAIYRAFHTIKGVASFLNLDEVRTLAHEAEALLNTAREGRVVLQGAALDLAFASVDGLNRQVAFARRWLTTGGPLWTDEALPSLLASLDDAVHGRATAPISPPPAEVSDESTGGEQPATPPAGDHNLAASQSRHDARTKEAVRVDRDRLDKLINAIGELVIAESMVQQEISSLIQGDMHMLRSLPLMAKISRELQEQSLSLRMVPLSSTFQKVGRMVRDLGKKLKKEIEFVAEGADTELDKSVVDMLGDPLVHMVRNSADHGIETGEERVANGKRPQARITLRAYHQSGNTYLELEDDGRGLNRERILAKAIERGLVRTTDTLTDEEVYELIFQPGFSTAAVVTDVSGRGVGLDVVRRNIEALRGGVQIRSRPGQGTVFTLRLPLTLASIDGLAVCLNGELYIIPMGSVIESVRPKSGSVRTVCGRGEVVMVRQEAIPLIRLHRLLRQDATDIETTRGLVVVVENCGRQYGLLVDELHGQLQVVMKSLEDNYRKIDGVSGATILGDGRVALILDIPGILRLNSRGPGAEFPALLADSSKSAGNRSNSLPPIPSASR